MQMVIMTFRSSMEDLVVKYVGDRTPLLYFCG